MPKYAIVVDEQFVTRLLVELARFDTAKNDGKIMLETRDANCAAMQIARTLVPFFEKELKEVKE